MTTKECKARWERMEVARKAIADELLRRHRALDLSVKALDPKNYDRWYHPQDNYYSGEGEMPCPICKVGTLRYSRSGYNGHVHAFCGTETCVRFME